MLLITFTAETTVQTTESQAMQQQTDIGVGVAQNQGAPQ